MIAHTIHRGTASPMSRQQATTALAKALNEHDRLKAEMAKNNRLVAAALQAWGAHNGAGFVTEAAARQTLQMVGLIPGPAVRLIAENDLPADTPRQAVAERARGRG